MEKRKPTYDLGTIKATFSSVETLRMTVSAQNGAFALGILRQDVDAIVQSITRPMFVKSMTSHATSAIWQDVYNVPANGLVLYVKFTIDATGHLLISFKEK